MDKRTLNNEIVLCRGSVRKARVIVIRKMVKKLKILKSCKVEANKEKKLRKVERLFEKIQIMKKVKDDEVTKFALRNSDLEHYLQGPKVDQKQSALAHLAKYEAVAKKVASIREQFQNWETQLPPLLDSLGMKKNSRKKLDVKANLKVPKQDDKATKSDNDGVTEKVREGVKIKSKVFDKGSVKKTRKSTSKSLKAFEENECERGNEGRDDISPKEILNEKSKITKIDDPFFIEKKVIAPKLLLESGNSVLSENVKCRKSSDWTEKYQRENNRTSMFHTKPFKVKKEANNVRATKPSLEPSEEKLHPSWVAKKVKLIKPFQGKRIKFSEE